MSCLRAVSRSACGLLLCLLLGGALSIMRGQDASWDLKNYHIYNAWAWLHGHGIDSGDLAPAGLQSYFNPLPDLPYQWLGSHWLLHFPRLLAAVQGLWFGAFLYLLWSITAELARQQGRRLSRPDICAFLIGASGTMVISQTGLSSNEVMLAVWVLLSVRWLMALYTTAARPWPCLLAAGVCCGLAAGLKPTAIVYAPALALSLGLTAKSWRQGLQRGLIFTLAATVGFGVTYGWWGWQLYEHTGNPVFPLFNQVFQSPLTTTANLADQRFKPASLAQWMFYPFYWLFHNKMRVTEPTFADPRYALAMLAMGALAIRSLLHSRFQPRPAGTINASRFLIVFLGIAYLLWLVMYSILRYAIPIEALTGLLMLLAVQSWAASPWPGRARVIDVSMLALLLLCAATSDYPGWGHARYASTAFGVAPLSLPPGSTLVLLGQPTAYIVPFIDHADCLHLVGITELTVHSKGYGLWQLTRQAVTQSQHPLFVILRNEAAPQLQWLSQWLPGLRLGSCQPIRSAIERGRNGKDFSDGLRICRVSPPITAAS